MPATVYTELRDIVCSLQIEMERLGIWSDQWPPEAAFRSVQPFCIDTLSFDQWVQFVLLERLAAIIEIRGALPSASSIAEMADEIYAGQQDKALFVSYLRRFDQLVQRGGGQ